MKKVGLLFAMVGAVLMLTTNVMAQGTGTQESTLTVNEVALIDGTGTVIMNLDAAIAGNAVAVAPVIGYVKVSSVVAFEQTRTITASIGALPAGSALTIATAVPANANFGGAVGTGSAAQAITNVDGDIILATAIGSCYTGTGATDGYQLTYSWTPVQADYADFVATSTSVPVTLTITAGL